MTETTWTLGSKPSSSSDNCASFCSEQCAICGRNHVKLLWFGLIVYNKYQC